MPQLKNGYLRLANELVEAYTRSRIPGEAMQCLWFIIRKTYGFGKLEDKIAISQFSEATGLKKQHAHRAISKLVELNLVTKNGDGLIVSYRINKDSSTWKLSPKKVTYPKKVTSVPKKGDKEYPKMVNTKDTLKDTITKESIYSVFDFWNSQGITKHKTIDKSKPSINASLKDYSEDEIKKAIINYNTILNDSVYYWTHKWTLKEFLQRGMDKFRDENNPFNNYKQNKKKSKTAGNWDLLKQEQEAKNDRSGENRISGNIDWLG